MQGHSPSGHVMDLDVIGMAVVAVEVIADDDVRSDLVEDRGQSPARLVGAGGVEGALGVVLDPAVHP